jgi:hypothetical protein
LFRRSTQPFFRCLHKRQQRCARVAAPSPAEMCASAVHFTIELGPKTAIRPCGPTCAFQQVLQKAIPLVSASCVRRTANVPASQDSAGSMPSRLVPCCNDESPGVFHPITSPSTAICRNRSAQVGCLAAGRTFRVADGSLTVMPSMNLASLTWQPNRDLRRSVRWDTL